MKLEMKLPCPKSEAIESYEILLAVCRTEDAYLAVGYKQMRDLLERICRAQMQNESLQMTDLSARISFVAAKVGLSVAEQNRLHTFRLTSNAILNRQQEPNREQLLRDAKTLAFFIRKLLEEDIPLELYRLLPRADATYLVAPPARERVQRMRVCFQYADEQYLYVTPLDEVSEKPYLVRYNIPQINEEFAETCKLLWRHAQVNLLDVAVDEAGILTPSFIVLEPDYLLDISSLAECFRDYGHHPANYFLSRLQPIENARPLLLGNIANLFLDEWIHAKSEDIDYRKPSGVILLSWLPVPICATKRKNANSLRTANCTSIIFVKRSMIPFMQPVMNWTRRMPCSNRLISVKHSDFRDVSTICSGICLLS